MNGDSDPHKTDERMIILAVLEDALLRLDAIDEPLVAAKLSAAIEQLKIHMAASDRKGN